MATMFSFVNMPPLSRRRPNQKIDLASSGGGGGLNHQINVKYKLLVALRSQNSRSREPWHLYFFFLSQLIIIPLSRLPPIQCVSCFTKKNLTSCRCFFNGDNLNGDDFAGKMAHGIVQLNWALPSIGFECRRMLLLGRRAAYNHQAPYNW